MSANATVIRADGTIDASNQKSTFETFFELYRVDTRVEKALRIDGSREHTCLTSTSFTKLSSPMQAERGVMLESCV